MRVAITGGTGFVGRHLARRLSKAGHHAVLVARGVREDDGTSGLPGIERRVGDVTDVESLRTAFAGCEAVAHLAGINREIGAQTYERVHVQGTRNVVDAAGHAGVRRIALLSFVRARPDCGIAYHESKWAAEEIVRSSGLEFTVLKAGVIHGRGDHLLDHLSRSLRTLPVFAPVGFRPTRLRPTAGDDVARVLEAALVGGALRDSTVAVLGPEELTLAEVVRRVGAAIGRRPLLLPMPVFVHVMLARLLEATMKVPLIAVAQVRMLAEGMAEPLPGDVEPPEALRPSTPFSPEVIARGLPERVERFGLRDLRGFG